MATLRRERVYIGLDGCVVCPWHGAQPWAVEYAPGAARCGCQWTRDRAGRLWAVKADCVTVAASTTPLDSVLPDDAKNAG